MKIENIYIQKKTFLELAFSWNVNKGKLETVRKRCDLAHSVKSSMKGYIKGKYIKNKTKL